MSTSDDSSRPNSASSSAPHSAPRTSLIDRLRALLGLKGHGSTIREDLEDALTSGDVSAPDFSPEERSMLKNVLGLRGLTVDDAMVPRPDIVALASTASIGEALDVFRAAEHSRLPVYGETLDEPLGIIHIKDLLAHITTQSALAAAGEGGGYDLSRVDLGVALAALDIVRPVLYVPPSMPAIDLLVQMQSTRMHLALVIDEYGGTDGLVTIEDLVEMVVGDIEDEHDDEEVAMIVVENEGFVADALITLEELESTLGIDFTDEEAADDVDTLGGLLVTLAGHVPLPGEIIEGQQNLIFEVLEADHRRVKRVRITRQSPSLPEDAGRRPDDAGEQRPAS